MQIPEFWAEVRVEGEVGDKRRVVRRFGWSDESQFAAEAHAQDRADAAFAELRAGNFVPQREKKLAYGGEGLPIREEVVARNGLDVITRNRYGARCLNEPDVLFVDIDMLQGVDRPLGVGCLITVVGVCTGIGMIAFGQTTLGWTLFAAAILWQIASVAFHIRRIRSPSFRDRRLQVLRERVDRVLTEVTSTRFAVYETPAGLRLLALHATFDPKSEATQALFRAFGADPDYAMMCALQACFRARVSAKPWRVGLETIPTRSVWPVPEDRLAERAEWIARYEQAATDFAACRHIGDIGTAPIDPRCATVQRMHDELCRARTNHPIA